MLNLSTAKVFCLPGFAIPCQCQNQCQSYSCGVLLLKMFYHVTIQTTKNSTTAMNKELIVCDTTVYNEMNLVLRFSKL